MPATAHAAPRAFVSQFPHPTATPAACRCQHMPAPDVEFVPTLEALAQAMRDQYPNCTEETLQAEGFSLAFQKRHGDAARELATKTFVRHVEPHDDRQSRIERAAYEAAGLVNQAAIVSHLLICGYQPRELGDIMPDVIDRLCQIVVENALAPAQVQ